MNDTAFEKLEAAAAVLKLDFSSEEFASFAEEQELTEAEMRYLVRHEWARRLTQCRQSFLTSAKRSSGRPSRRFSK